MEFDIPVGTQRRQLRSPGHPHGGDAAVDLHHAAMRRRSCWRRTGRGRSTTRQGKVAPPPRAEMKRSMEALIHHFKLYHRRLPRAGRRGLRGRRGAQGRVRRLSRVATAPTSPIAARSGRRASPISRRWTSCAATTCWPTSPPSWARSISCSARSTADAARLGRVRPGPPRRRRPPSPPRQPRPRSRSCSRTATRSRPPSPTRPGAPTSSCSGGPRPIMCHSAPRQTCEKLN